MNNSPEVDQYISSIDGEFQAPMRDLRAQIHKYLPEGEEVFAYNIPVYKYRGKALFSIAAFQNHYSLITEDKNIVTKIPELGGYKLSGTTLHFNPTQPLTEPLLKRIIDTRVASRDSSIS
jgi:uncharacterized protein YdhG (YjbR/CyaY superfamily)